MATQIFSVNYHRRRPNMDITLSYDASRINGEQSNTMRYTFYADLYCKPGEIYASSNATGITVSVDGVSRTFYCVGQGSATTEGPWTTSNSVTFDTSNTSTNGSTGVSIYVWCHQGTYQTPEGTNFNCTATGGPYDYSWSGNINVPVYNPYKASTISFRGTNPLTGISRINTGSWKVNYKVTSPTGATIKDTGIDIMVFGTKDNVLQNHSFGTAVGDRQGSFTIKSSGTNIKDGMKFTTRLYVNDLDNNGVWHYIHNTDTNQVTRTYKIPVMTNITNFTKPFSPQDNTKLYWTTNCRVWATSGEDEFVTSVMNNSKRNLKLDKDDGVPQEPTNNIDGTNKAATQIKTPLILDSSVLNDLFDKNDRSNLAMTSGTGEPRGYMNGVIRVERDNPSATRNGGPYTAWATTTIQVQYQPTKSPTNGTVTYNNKSISRNTIFIQDIKTIDIDWSYPVKPIGGAAGIVDGYILRVYSDSGYTQQYGKDKVIQVTQNASNAKWKLNTKTELKRGVLNYLKITPYYDKPNGTGKIEGQKSLQMALVTPISRINTPVIEYPINNSNWHNKNFRILLQLPSDDDISELGLSNDEYRYQDIELKITPNNMSANVVTYSFKNNPEIFSTDTLSHTKKIAINPSVLDTLPNASTYKLELRVQKKYYITIGENSYSKWSTAVIVKNTALNNLNLTSGQEIELSHYDYVRNASVRLHDTYPIYTLNSNNVSQKVGDQIDYKEYDGMITDILNIQKGVNGYCSYDQDRNDIKFQNTINTLNGEQEYITAELDGTEIDGRNYMNILINEMNKLI